MPKTSRFSCRAFATTHSTIVSSAARGSGLPAPGRSSKSPRAMPREIWESTQVSNDIPGGLRSVIAIHRDTGLPGSACGRRAAERSTGTRGRGSARTSSSCPDGSTCVYGVVERPDFALVLAVDRDGFWLVEQFRHPIGRRALGVPAGHLDPRRATGPPEELARAELAEETGFRAARLDHLGRLDLAPGLMTQRFDVWRATGLVAGPTAREASEADMRSAFVPEAELRAMIRDGRFTDGPSLAAYSLLLLLGVTLA